MHNSFAGAVCGFTLLLLLPILAAAPAGVAGAAGGETVSIANQEVIADFPNTLTFKAHLESSAKVTRVVLEYGVEKRTCGTVTAKGFPLFTPGTSIDVGWTWDMHKSGSEPPGARIWYRWRATDEAGHEALSVKQIVLWLDQAHNWQSITQGDLTLHWYAGSDGFAHALLDSATQSLAQLSTATGVAPQRPIDLYIYGSGDDLQKAVLYQPNWTGGLAFPDHDIVLIGIAPEELDWGMKSEAHELTHALVGQLAFSCLRDIPTWLDEGIAMYGQGGPDPASVRHLEEAIRRNQLVSLHVLSGGFSERADKADLAYSESYSVVTYLIATYGREKLNALFTELGRGAKVEDSLNHVYGFGLNSLETHWRESIGAQHMEADSTPAATPVPTPVPTYSISNAPPSSALVAQYPNGSGSPDPRPFILATLGIMVPLCIVGAGAYLTLRRGRRA